MIAASAGVAAAYVAAWLLVVGGAGVVALLKGRYAAFVVGLLTLGLVWIVAAIWPARADSRWSRRSARQPS